MPSTVGTPQQGSFNAATVTPTLPTGYAAGDALLCVVSMDGTQAIDIDDPNSGPGWEKIQQWTSGSATTTQAAFYLPDAAGDASDVLVVDAAASERGTWVHVAITGQDPTAGAFFVGTGAAGSAAANACNPPNLAPAPGSDTYLWVAVGGTGANVDATAAPTNFSGLLSEATTTSSMGTFMAFREFAAASQDPGVFTHASGAWQAQTIAIPPGAAGTTHDLGTTIAATAALTAALQPERQMSTTISAVGALTAALQPERLLAVSIGGSAAVTPALRQGFALATSIAAVGVVNPALTQSGTHFLETLIAGSGAVSPLLSLGASLASLIEAQGTVAPALRAGFGLAVGIHESANIIAVLDHSGGADEVAQNWYNAHRLAQKRGR